MKREEENEERERKRSCLIITACKLKRDSVLAVGSKFLYSPATI